MGFIFGRDLFFEKKIWKGFIHGTARWNSAQVELSIERGRLVSYGKKVVDIAIWTVVSGNYGS